MGAESGTGIRVLTSRLSPIGLGDGALVPGLRRALILLCLLTLVLLPAFPASAHETTEKTDIKIGVLAKRGAERTLSKWGNTAAYLDKAIPGYHFHIVPMKFDEIPVLVDNRLVDFVIVNSAIYVDLGVRYGVRRLVTLKNRLSPGLHLTRFGSVVFSHAGRPAIETFPELKGKRVAAVHRTSLGGWIMALREFEEAGVTESDLDGVSFLETHDAVVQAVLDKQVDAGVVRTDTLERMAKEGKISLKDFRVVGPRDAEDFPFRLSTRLYPEWPIAKVKHVSNDLAKAVATALIQMPQDSPAANSANIDGWTIPENYQPVHDILRMMALSPYENFGEVSLTAVVRTYRYWLMGFGLGILILVVLGARIVRLNRALGLWQADLQQSEERFKGTFEQAAVGMVHCTPEGGLVLANKKLCEMSGFSEYELRQLNVNDLTDPDDLPEELLLFDRLRRGEIPHFSVQKRIIRKDGKRRWVQQTVSCLRDDAGELKSLVAVVDDIEKTKELERSIDHEQKQRDMILNIAGDGILGLDSEGRHTFVNLAAARMLGWEVSDMLGQLSHAMWHHTRPDGSPFPESACPITSVLEQGKVHRGRDEFFWRKNGSPFRAEYISTPIVEGDEITGAVVGFREYSGGSDASSTGDDGV